MKRGIDPRLAIILYDAGHSWAEIGQLLAEQQHRRSPFQGASVYYAVRNYDLDRKRRPPALKAKPAEQTEAA